MARLEVSVPHHARGTVLTPVPRSPTSSQPGSGIRYETLPFALHLTGNFPFCVKRTPLFSIMAAYRNLCTIPAGTSTFTGEAGHWKGLLTSQIRSTVPTHFPDPAEYIQKRPHALGEQQTQWWKWSAWHVACQSHYFTITAGCETSVLAFKSQIGEGLKWLMSAFCKR